MKSQFKYLIYILFSNYSFSDYLNDQKSEYKWRYNYLRNKKSISLFRLYLLYHLIKTLFKTFYYTISLFSKNKLKTTQVSYIFITSTNHINSIKHNVELGIFFENSLILTSKNFFELIKYLDIKFCKKICIIKHILLNTILISTFILFDLSIIRRKKFILYSILVNNIIYLTILNRINHEITANKLFSVNSFFTTQLPYQYIHFFNRIIKKSLNKDFIAITHGVIENIYYFSSSFKKYYVNSIYDSNVINSINRNCITCVKSHVFQNNITHYKVKGERNQNTPFALVFLTYGEEISLKELHLFIKKSIKILSDLEINNVAIKYHPRTPKNIINRISDIYSANNIKLRCLNYIEIETLIHDCNIIISMPSSILFEFKSNSPILISLYKDTNSKSIYSNLDKDYYIDTYINSLKLSRKNYKDFLFSLNDLHNLYFAIK